MTSSISRIKTFNSKSFGLTAPPFPICDFSSPSARLFRMWRRQCWCSRALGKYLPLLWKPGIHPSTRTCLWVSACCWQIFPRSIFRRPYFLTRFLPALLKPRLVSTFMLQFIYCFTIWYVSKLYMAREPICKQILSFSAPIKTWLSDEFNWSPKKVSSHQKLCYLEIYTKI